MRVIVAGALANKPFNGGEAWVRLSWIRGLETLGAEVHFIEQLARDACTDPAGRPAPFRSSCNRDWFRAVTRQFGLEDRSSLLVEDGSVVEGPTPGELEALAESADLLINISGHLSFPAVFDRIPLRAYVDIDPGFTQIWLATGEPGFRLADHDLHFTIGENIGTAACSLPLAGIEWIPVRQPVVLEDWPVQPAVPGDAFTTVSSWRGAFGRVRLGDRLFGLKAHEFRKLASLPGQVVHPLEIALDIHPADDADRQLLEGHGWRLVDPRVVVPDPDSFRSYVAASTAELSVAQGVYTETNSGWFSDRTTRYLASGRPVVVQDTGFGRSLPVGDGLLSFHTPAEARDAVNAVTGNYGHHAAAAREIATEFFDSRKVLNAFLDDIDFRRSRRARKPMPATAHGNGGASRASRPLTIVVSGMLAGVPGQGGAAWAVLQYVLGLRRLGHDVHFVEPVAVAAGARQAPISTSPSAQYIDDVARSFDLNGRLALIRPGTRDTYGRTWDEIKAVAERADVLINLSGLLREPDLVDGVPVRVYLDLDPGFTQLWHDAQGVDMGFDGHTHFITVGTAIGTSACPIPTCGLSWIPTVQPLLLDEWPACGPVERKRLTTVANWRGYGSIERDGVLYGQKAHSLRQLFELPSLTEVPLELALSIHEDEKADIEALDRNGWERVDPAQVAATPDRYRRFVQESWAEFGLAKSGYVHSRCGWFSDRSLCYLASGRPVVAQETGFSDWLPGDEGVLPFEDTATAVTAINSLNADWERHARAARSIAEQVFDSSVVLARLLERIGVQ